MLENNLEILEASKKALAKEWALTDKVIDVLPQEVISSGKFEKQYAIGVIEYLIGILKKENSIGNCPVIHLMLEEFSSYNLSSEKVFAICSQFRKVLMNFIFEQNFADQKTIEQVNYILDENFQGVIRAYDHILENKNKEIQEHKNIFSEYNNAFNYATIISKTDVNGRSRLSMKRLREFLATPKKNS